MASGDFLFSFEPPHGSAPATLAATLDIVPGTSTPVENMHVYDFDASTAEYMDFFGTLATHYSGGGLTCTVEASASSATSSNFRIGLAFRLRDTTDDWDTTAHTYVFNEASYAVPGTVGLSVTGTIAFTAGADMDSVVAGSRFVLRVYRNVAHADDVATGDMQFERLYATET